MPAARMPAALVDLALDALEEEVGCWKRIPWRDGYTRLMRFPPMRLPLSAHIISDDTETVVYHDVPTKIADDILMRIAMEKVVETILGAVSVVSE